MAAAKIVGLEVMGLLQMSYFALAEFKEVQYMIAPLLDMKSVNGFNELDGNR